jgi:hypothetical protein
MRETNRRASPEIKVNDHRTAGVGLAKIDTHTVLIRLPSQQARDHQLATRIISHTIAARIPAVIIAPRAMKIDLSN